MSEFSNALYSIDLRERRATLAPQKWNIKWEMEPHADINRLSFEEHYSLIAKYEMRFWVPQGSENELYNEKEHAKRCMIEGVFGEFRKPIWEIKNALMLDRDIQKAMECIEKLERQMYE